MSDSETSSPLTITLKSVSEASFTLKIDAENTVLEVKEKIFAEKQIAVEAQRLIFKGKILKDPQIVGEIGIIDGSTVHLVASKRTQNTGTPSTSAASTQPAGQSGNVNPTGSTGGSANMGNPPPAQQAFGFPGLGLNNNMFGGGGGPNAASMQSMLQDPQAMNNMLNSPMMQMILNNPELMREMMMANPQIRQLQQENPELARMLMDPENIRQAIEMQRNPALMQEMIRNSDRAMSNLESIPGGYAALQNLYENVQQPLLDATNPENPTGTQAQAGGNNNPWEVLLGNNNSGAQQGGQTAQGGNNAQSGNNNQGGNGDGQTANANNNASPFGMFGAMGGGAGGNQAAENALFESLLSNPELMQQMLASNPYLQGNPEMQRIASEMAANPEIMRQSMEMMRQHPELVQQAQAAAMGGGMGMGGMGRMGGMGGMGGFGGFQSPFGNAAGATPQQQSNTSTTSLSPEQARERFTSQLQQLQDMGFPDEDANIQALIATNGSVQMAVERLLR